MQHEPAADGDADGGNGTLERGQKPADDDVEADKEIRNAVAAEGVDGVFDKLARGVREIGAHDLGGKEENEHEQYRREHAHGRERVAQELAAARVVLLAVVIAHERLRALRDADHEVDDDGRHIGDDRVGHDAVRADAAQHCAVEEKDHQTRAQLRHAVREADGQDARIEARIEAELPQAEGALFAEKVDEVRNAGDELGNARGDRRAEDAHIEPKDGDVIEHAVRQASADDREERVARVAVGLDEHLKVVGDEIAHAERRDAKKIMLDIVERDVIRAEKTREGV